MGDRRRRALGVQFDGKLRLEFHGAKITSDAGLLPFRELDDAFRLTEQGSIVLSEPRHGKNTQHTILATLRQGVYARLAGYEDVNDAERLGVDPAMRRVLLPIIGQYRDRDIPEYFRGDAAFAMPALYGPLEVEDFMYTIRIPANDVLMGKISPPPTRPVGRPSHKPKVFYESFSYQAQSWDHPRRVVAKVESHFDQRSPPVGFIVTNMAGWSRKVVKFYNGRGTAGQWIKEGKYAVKWTRLSCRGFKDDQARLQLFALAYNLGNFLRRLAVPRSVKHWSLTTLREKLIKIGPKVVRHAKYVTFQMTEVAVPRELFAAILDRIQRFGVPPPLLRPA